jgi:hypothetical protein
MPGDPGEPVVTTLVRFLFLHTRLRVHWTPGIPHALCWAEGFCKTRARMRRGKAESYFNVIACDKREAFAQGSESDEAIHSSFVARWIASLALAMTVSQPLLPGLTRQSIYPCKTFQRRWITGSSPVMTVSTIRHHPKAADSPAAPG